MKLSRLGTDGDTSVGVVELRLSLVAVLQQVKRNSSSGHARVETAFDVGYGMSYDSITGCNVVFVKREKGKRQRRRNWRGHSCICLNQAGGLVNLSLLSM